MRILLATVSRGRDEAESRLNQLKSQFPGSEFEITDHDTRFQIELTNATQTLEQPTIDQMRRVASGS